MIRKGYIYLPPYTTFYGGIGSLLHDAWITYTITCLDVLKRSINASCNFQPSPPLFLDEFWLFLVQFALIFGQLFLYLEYNIKTMAKYIVEVNRVTYSYATVEVEAESEQDAENKAFERAMDGDIDFEIGDSEDEVVDIYPAEGSPFA